MFDGWFTNFTNGVGNLLGTIGANGTGLSEVIASFMSGGQSVVANSANATAAAVGRNWQQMLGWAVTALLGWFAYRVSRRGLRRNPMAWFVILATIGSAIFNLRNAKKGA